MEQANTHVYIDESGETGSRSSYIVFASIETETPRALEKMVRKIWRAKPQVHGHGELHANAVDDAIRTRVLKSISEQDLRIRFHIIDKSAQTQPLGDVYYLELAAFIAQHPQAQIVVVDRKDTDKKRAKMINKLALEDAFMNVEFESSHRVRQLQAVDFVAWAIGRFYEHGDNTFIEMIKENVNE